MLIKKNLIIIILLLLGLSLTPASIKADTKQIYPYGFSVSGGVNSYWAGGSCWDGQVHQCSDSGPNQDTSRFVSEPSDSISTFKQSGGAWFSDSKVYPCCQGNEWKISRDTTRNHPTESVNFADQSIVIPPGVTKITRVLFYDLTTDSTNNLVLALYPLSSGEYPTSGHIGGSSGVLRSPAITPKGGTNYAVDFNNISNWDVTPGNTYYIRIKNNNNDNLSLPVSSNCGAAGTSCKWWIDWGGVPTAKTTSERAPHSQTDVYPQGKAYSGYRSGTGPITPSAYFNDIKGTGADLARVAVWGDVPPLPPPPTFPSPAASCPAPGSSAAVSWNASSGATYYALRVNNTIDGWDESCSSPGRDFCSRETATSKTFTSIPGASYSWWLHACNSSGCSAATRGPDFTCPPAPPSNLSASCPAPGTLATVSWDPTSGAASYKLRVNYLEQPAPTWGPCFTSSTPNDFCLDGYTATSQAFTAIPGGTYSWWLHACNSSSCSDPANGPQFTCTATPIRLDSLTISSGLTPSITGGAAKTLGRTAEEKGSNWYNPLDISLSASGGIGSTTQYYVAFYDKKEGTGTVKTAYSSLDPVKQLLKNDPSAGFILRYDVSNSKYYVWDWSASSGTDCIVNKGCFWDITTVGSAGYPIYNSAREVLYWAYPKPEKSHPTWQVKIMAAFGSKNMYTPGYIVNAGSSPVNKDFNPDMQPIIPIPISSLPSIKQLVSFYFQRLLALL